MAGAVRAKGDVKSGRCRFVLRSGGDCECAWADG